MFFEGRSTTKLSSAGLVYKYACTAYYVTNGTKRHFGKEVLQAEIDEAVSEQKLETLYQRVYDEFIEALDANDNGVSRYPADVKARYVDKTSLPARVSRLNPRWNETGVNMQERFLQASALAGGEFRQAVHDIYFSKLPARKLVEEMCAMRFSTHSSGKILKMQTFCPWKV